ncbi:MAG: flagellar basal body rod protein FlgC [Deltaproteobacteria bacterium]|jgi:flagellar basal-body rod protein FlgC|nr:flagellar basal body rod protein FlgC [Deltaproteobacteria bacterium]
MEFYTPFKICGEGLAVQRAKMDVIVSNIANVHTTRTPEGGPYKRKVVVFSSEKVDGNFESKLRDAVRTVKVDGVEEAGTNESTKMMHMPGHPDADERGFVSMPNINVVTEMVDMMLANRAYEACVTAFDASKNMALKTLEIGK